MNRMVDPTSLKEEEGVFIALGEKLAVGAEAAKESSVKPAPPEFPAYKPAPAEISGAPPKTLAV